MVHPESDVLTIEIDTQDKGFWYEIRGWQFGPSLTSWLVKAGYIPSASAGDFSALDQLLFADEQCQTLRSYYDAAGREYKIGYGIIDSAGHRTAEVYAWCKRTGIFASKGAKGRKVHPVTVSQIETYPGVNKPIPGGLKLYHLDTHYHKDILANKLTIDPSDPGAWVLHSGYDAVQKELLRRDPDVPLANGLLPYAKQFCVEYRNEKYLWECPEGAANHLFDCAQMGVALAYYLGFDKMTRETDAGQREQPAARQQQQTTAGGRPGWFQGRGRR